MLGKVIQIDNATLNKDRMSFARVLVEIDVKCGLHKSIAFTDEDNELVCVQVTYDWHPVLCAKCKQMGHMEDSSRARVTKRWVAKPTTQAPSVDIEGFQMVRGRDKGSPQIRK